MKTFSHEIISLALGGVTRNLFWLEFGTWPDLGPCPAIDRPFYYYFLTLFLLLITGTVPLLLKDQDVAWAWHQALNLRAFPFYSQA